MCLLYQVYVLELKKYVNRVMYCCVITASMITCCISASDYRYPHDLAFAYVSDLIFCHFSSVFTMF